MAATSTFLHPFTPTTTLFYPSIATPPSLRLPFRCWIASPIDILTARLRLVSKPSRFRKQRLLVAQQAAAQAEEKQDEEKKEQQTIEEDSDEAVNGCDLEESTVSTVQALVNRYKKAISSNDASEITNVELQLVALQEERDALERQAGILTDEVSTGKERFLRLNADFDNFRKRSERDKLSMTTTVRGDVIESLLPMIDNFERAKTQIKAETEAEQKIDSSYQGIYKQFIEIMRGLGVSEVQTVGKEFNPNLHEAIMREKSTEYLEGIVTQEFRRGFMLDGKLVRPATVKVSAGPGPTKPDAVTSSEVPPEVVEGTESEAEPTSS